MAHYMVVYSDRHQELEADQFPRKRTVYVLSNSGTMTALPRDVPEAFNAMDRDLMDGLNELNKPGPETLHVRWALKTLKTSDETKRIDQIMTVDEVDQRMLDRNVRSKIAPYELFASSYGTMHIKDHFKNPLHLRPTHRFLAHLYEQSPIFYECFKRLCLRKGKTLVYSSVQLTGREDAIQTFYSILKEYVVENGTENRLFRVPGGYDVRRFLKDKLFYIDSKSTTVSTVISDFTRSPDHHGLDAPILLLGAAHGTGTNIRAGVREMHVLSFELSEATEKQHLGRPLRKGAMCFNELKFPDDWLLTYYVYLNTGLYPKAMTSCSMLFLYLRQNSQIDDITAYFYTLMTQAALTCEAHRKDADEPCASVMPPIPPHLVMEDSGTYSTYDTYDR
jgi:hypothetical protein